MSLSIVFDVLRYNLYKITSVSVRCKVIMYIIQQIKLVVVTSQRQIKLAVVTSQRCADQAGGSH